MIPSLAINVQGIGSVTADNLNTFVQTCTTAAVLRTFVGQANMVIALQGIATPNDGNSGIFYWSATGTAPDDNLNTIVPTAAPTSGGEWIRLTASAIGVTLAGDVAGPAGANVIQPLVVTSGKIALLAVGTAQIAALAVTAAKIANATITTTQIASNAGIVNGQLATMPDQTIKGNVSGGLATPSDITLTTLKTSLGITKFASPTHTPISTGLNFSDTHGLGTRPAVYIAQGYMKCLTAELNYSIGDTVVIASNNGFQGSNGSGANVWVNDTSIGMSFSAQGTPVTVNNKTTGQISAITNANWSAFTTLVYFS